MSAPEAELPARLKRREEGALEELTAAYTRPLMAGAFAMGFGLPDAEELAQETLVAFLGALDRFEGRSKLKTYLFGILYNKAADLLRKRGREEGLEEIEEGFETRFDARGLWARPPKGPEALALTREIRDLIEECVRALPARQRAAFFLKEVEGEEPEGICNALGVNATHLRVLMHRARIKLRECLEKKWGERP